MSGWLNGKTMWVVGNHPALVAALHAQGVGQQDSAEADILLHISPAQGPLASSKTEYAVWRASMDNGLDQRFFAAREFAAACRAGGKGGAILFVSPAIPREDIATAAAAGASENLTKTLAVEWARDGIRVNMIRSNSHAAALGRLAAYLVSDYAAYVTGAVMGVDADDQ